MPLSHHLLHTNLNLPVYYACILYSLSFHWFSEINIL